MGAPAKGRFTPSGGWSGKGQKGTYGRSSKKPTVGFTCDPR
ncbi:hypothetical protein HMPREF1556_01209 [Porphyromonas sp. oral taxon 278 str. W7784]|nr:hypothetical protein HMPREF1556_01209 [Porphyromonas sp. oral taxon 278 str. W7784]